MNFKEVELEVIRWAEDRKIIPNSTPLAQTRKTLEEVGELTEAATGLATINRLVKLNPTLNDSVAVQLLRDDLRAEFKDAVGDVLVTLINSCALADVDLTQCLELAYNEIKDRKGTLLPNGVFQKVETPAAS